MRLDNFGNSLSPVNSHSNSNKPSVLFPNLYQRHALLRLGRRRSRCLKTAQGAAADNACRDGAPRGARASSQEARAPRDPHPLETLGPGSSACRPADRKAGLREPIARLPGRLPALHPSPMERGGKQGTGSPGSPKKHRAGTAERWLNAGFLVQPELAADRPQLGRLNQPAVRDRHRMQRPFELLDPEGQEALQLGEFREQVVVLPDVGLQKPGVVGTPLQDLSGCQPEAAQLSFEVF